MDKHLLFQIQVLSKKQLNKIKINQMKLEIFLAEEDL